MTKRLLTEAQCDRLYMSLGPDQKRALVMTLDTYSVEQAGYKDPNEYRDVLTFLAPHLDLVTYGRLKQCCQVFNVKLSELGHDKLQRIHDWFCNTEYNYWKREDMPLDIQFIASKIFWNRLEYCIDRLDLKWRTGINTFSIAREWLKEASTNCWLKFQTVYIHAYDGWIVKRNSPGKIQSNIFLPDVEQYFNGSNVVSDKLLDDTQRQTRKHLNTLRKLFNVRRLIRC